MGRYVQVYGRYTKPSCRNLVQCPGYNELLKREIAIQFYCDEGMGNQVQGKPKTMLEKEDLNLIARKVAIEQSHVIFADEFRSDVQMMMKPWEDFHAISQFQLDYRIVGQYYCRNWLQVRGQSQKEGNRVCTLLQFH